MWSLVFINLIVINISAFFILKKRFIVIFLKYFDSRQDKLRMISSKSLIYCIGQTLIEYVGVRLLLVIIFKPKLMCANIKYCYFMEYTLDIQEYNWIKLNETSALFRTKGNCQNYFTYRVVFLKIQFLLWNLVKIIKSLSGGTEVPHQTEQKSGKAVLPFLEAVQTVKVS